jgi:pyruvate dehydrogenase phosphatase
MSSTHSYQRRQTDMGWPNHGPFFYHSLPEPDLTSELRLLSNARFVGNADCVTFQPCPDPEQRSQDRYEIQDWHLSNGTWKFAGIFDGTFLRRIPNTRDFNEQATGHAGHETVDYTVATLPSLVKSSLISALDISQGNLPSTTVSNILVTEISAFDESLTQDLLDLFPGGTETLSKLSDAEIRAIINDMDSGGKNLAKVLRCMRGSTCLISLIDPVQSHLWVASLGDCQAGSHELSALSYILI